MAGRPDLRQGVVDAIGRMPGLDPLWDALEHSSDLTCFVAGGLVRDVLIGDPPSDVDLFVDGPDTPDLLATLSLAGGVGAGPFGSPRWTPRDTDRHVDVVPIRGFRNGLWPCLDMTDALNQFDFTCNAIAVDLREGTVLDPQNGRRDARDGVMRAVRFDYPDEPIAPGSPLSRPAVLWFRILHYAAAKQLEIDPVTRRWLEANGHLLGVRAAFEATFFSLHADALDGLSP